MPKRSNDFQRLVYLVRMNLAEGATVTESKMMRDRITRGYREVDVVIKGSVGSQKVVVAIECRDHKRVADVSWIDAMKAKHDRLETNALLLASSAGFTKEATEVARRYGIELFTLETQETADLPTLLGSDGSLWHKSYQLSAGKVSIRVAKTEQLEAETIATSPDNLLYLEDGSELCQTKDFVTEVLNSDRVLDYLSKEGREEHASFEFIWESPADRNGNPLFMQKIEPHALRRVESVRVTGPCMISIGQFHMRQGRLGSVRVAWGKAVVAGRDAMAVVTQSPSGETKFCIEVKGAP